MEDKRSKEVLAIEDQKADYAKKRFSMFAGAAEIVTLRAPKYMAGVMIDRFGTEVRMRREDEDILVRTEVEVSPQFSAGSQVWDRGFRFWDRRQCAGLIRSIWNKFFLLINKLSFTSILAYDTLFNILAR